MLKKQKCLLLIILFVTVYTATAQKKPTTRAEWEQKLRLAKHDTTRLTCYAEILRLISDGDSSFTYFLSKMPPLIKKYPNHYGGIVFLNSKAQIFKSKRADSTFYYLSKAQELSKKLKIDYYCKVASLNVARFESSSNTKILTNLLSLLKEHKFDPKNDSDKKMLVYIYSRIGESYSYIDGMHDKALHYSDMSKSFMNTTLDSVFFFRHRIIIISNLSDEFIQKFPHTHKIPYSASYKPFFDEAMAFCERNKGNDDALLLHHKLLIRFSKIHLLEKNYIAAMQYSNRAQQIEIPKRFSKNKQSQLDLILGQNYIGLGQYQRGIDLLEKVKAYHEKTNEQQPSNDRNYALSETYQYLAKGYKAKGEYKKAHEALEKYNAINHAFYGKEQLKVALEFEKQAELFEKQKEITQQKFEILLRNQQLKIEQEQANVLKLKTSLTLASKEKAIADQQNKLHTQETNLKNKEERLKSEQVQKNILAALFSVCFLLFCMSLWSYRKQSQLKQLLEKQNLRLATQTQALTETNHTKDKIFAVLGHDLRNPLYELKTILMLFYSKDITTPKMKELIGSLNPKMEAVQSMLNNLLEWSMIELNYQKSNNSHVADLQHIIENVVRQVQQNADKKTIQVFTQIQPTQIRANEHDIEVVLRNLMSNAIKFTPPKGRINLSVKADSNFVEVSLSDTGIGFVFREEEQFLSSKAGTVGEKGLGLGLKICRELVKNNGGTIDISSQLDTGTTVLLRFPVAA